MTASQCPGCGNALTRVEPYKQWYCYTCKAYRQPGAQPAAAAPQAGLWFQDRYRIRKKVLAIAQQYRIEDAHGRPLAYSKQKLMRLKEDIRVYSDESMARELFRIQQQNWTDTWGQFAIVDSATNTSVGFVRRKALKSMIQGEWEPFDAYQRPIGHIKQDTAKALVRRFVPMGGLVPDELTVELNGQPVAKIAQQFKVIGDIWDIDARWAPPTLDRRVLLGTAVLMGTIERQQGG